MKTGSVIFLSVMTVFSIMPLVRADVFSISSLPSNFGAFYTWSDAGEPWVTGVCFTASGTGTLSNAMFRLRSNGAATGTLSVKVFSVASDAIITPDNPANGAGCSKSQTLIATSASKNMQSLDTSFRDEVFTFSSGVSIISGSKYATTLFADFTLAGGIGMERSNTDTTTKAYVDSFCQTPGVLTFCDNANQVDCNSGGASACYVHNVNVNTPAAGPDCSVGNTCGINVGTVIATLIVLFVVLMAVYILQNFVLNPERKPDEGGYGGLGGEREGI